MRTIIEANCQDQRMEATDSPLIASGGRHEDFVHFTFCSKWDGFKKIAVFYRESKSQVPYYSELDSLDTCEIPHEVTDASGIIYFGVFGVLGEITRTSNMVKYKILNGAISTGLEPTDPSPDVWAQLLASYNDVIAKVEESNKAQLEFISEANKAVDDCNTAISDCYAAITVLNYQSIDANGGDPTMGEVVEDENDLNGGTPLYN